MVGRGKEERMGHANPGQTDKGADEENGAGLDLRGYWEDSAPQIYQPFGTLPLAIQILW